MPTVTLTWDDVNDNEDGFNIYRSTTPLDTANPANLPAPLATVAAGVGTYDDTTAAADTTYYYAVAATKGTFINAAGEVEVATAPPVTVDQAVVGDATEGGVYAGVVTYHDGRQYHLISATAQGELHGATWGADITTGADDADDGDANQALVLADFDNGTSYGAFYHCRDYAAGGNTDWYLPAIRELDWLYETLAGHSEFADTVASGDRNYSSTEHSSSLAKTRTFATGESGERSKTLSGYYRSRPVRRLIYAVPQGVTVDHVFKASSFDLSGYNINGFKPGDPLRPTVTVTGASSNLALNNDSFTGATSTYTGNDYSHLGWPVDPLSGSSSDLVAYVEPTESLVFRVSGLYPGGTYDLDFVGYRGSTGTRTLDITIGGVTVTLDNNALPAESASFTAVVADPDGQIAVNCTGGVGASFGYLSAFYLRESSAT